MLFERTEFVKCENFVVWKEKGAGKLIFMDTLKDGIILSFKISSDKLYLGDAPITSNSLDMNDNSIHTTKDLENGEVEHTLYFFSRKRFLKISKLVQTERN